MKPEDSLKQIITESILAESKKWKYHMIRKPDFLYKEKNVSIDSTKHIGLLKNTIQHLQALKSAYAVGSAMRHIISQTCSRLNRLVKKLESQPKA
jgi:hypothetical protein